MPIESIMFSEPKSPITQRSGSSRCSGVTGHVDVADRQRVHRVVRVGDGPSLAAWLDSNAHGVNVAAAPAVLTQCARGGRYATEADPSLNVSIVHGAHSQPSD